MLNSSCSQKKEELRHRLSEQQRPLDARQNDYGAKRQQKGEYCSGGWKDEIGL